MNKTNVRTVAHTIGLAGLVLGAAVGCGAGTEELSSTELASEMNLICADNGEKFEEIGHPENLEEIALMTPKMIEVFDSTLSKLDQLDAGNHASADVEEFVALGRQQSELMGRLQVAAASGDGADLDAVVGEMGAVAERSDAIASTLGATECVG
ncbi:MAG: hypothetical protein ACN4GZ_09325 [Acidimicrobiales bacterium]